MAEGMIPQEWGGDCIFKEISATIEKDLLMIRIYQKYTVIRLDFKYFKVLKFYIIYLTNFNQTT